MDLSKYFSKKPTLQVGVDIGSGALKIALLQLSHDRIKLLSYRCEDLSRLKEEEQRNDFVLQQVKDFIKAHALPGRNIHLVLPITNAVYTKTIKLPHMPPREIPNAAKWHIKDEVPVNIDEAEFGWQYALPQAKPLKPQIDIICAAAKKDFLNKYVELFKRSNISLSEITLSPFGINAILLAEESWTAVLDVGYKQSIFSMHTRGALLFMRTIHVGTNNFGSKTGTVEQGLMGPYIEHLSEEIVRCTKYCEIEFIKQAINRIYLTGGGANIEILQQQLKKVSGLDIKILRFPRDILVDGNIRKNFEANRISLQILPAVGAAARSASKIDLLPLEARAEKLLLAEKISFRLIGLTAMLVLIFSSFAVRLNVNIVKKRLSNAKAELVFLREAEVLKNEISNYNEVINRIKREHILPEWTLQFISSIIPESTVLNSYVFSNKDRSINLTGNIHTKSGSAEEAITEFIRKLKKIELFEDARLASIETKADDCSTFNIVCRLLK